MKTLTAWIDSEGEFIKPLVAGLTLVLALCSSNQAQAFLFSPMTINFDSSGNGATRSFQVENDSASNIAVDVSMASRTIDENGKENFEKIKETDKLFQIYPPQLLLKPKEKRTLRITWTGEAKPAQELAFRAIVEQLPVQTERPTTKKVGAVINILLKYLGAVYITPENAKPIIDIKEARLEAGKVPKLSVLFENKGNAHRVLNGIHLKLSSVGEIPKVVDLKPEELPEINGQNILAGHHRRFLIPWPKALPKGQVKVDFELEGQS